MRRPTCGGHGGGRRGHFLTALSLARPAADLGTPPLDELVAR
ncbi:hypothetical protein OOK13_29895 [Streptomyces sp. NBC_00378]|nr:MULTISPECIES: hypothetical protein [unclassified Streptomyces]MCX5112605.1 hypothetical protein [Streptomyces sp. NBC_00378]